MTAREHTKMLAGLSLEDATQSTILYHSHILQKQGKVILKDNFTLNFSIQEYILTLIEIITVKNSI